MFPDKERHHLQRLRRLPERPERARRESRAHAGVIVRGATLAHVVQQAGQKKKIPLRRSRQLAGEEYRQRLAGLSKGGSWSACTLGWPATTCGRPSARPTAAATH